MKYLPAAALLALALPCCAQDEGDPRGDLPVDPIRPAAHGAWASALLLTNDALSVAVDPGTGRIVDLAVAGGSNVLQAAEHAGGERLRLDAGTNRVTWSAHGWLSADGTRHARMSGALAGDRTVTRLIDVGRDTRRLRIRQEREDEGQPGETAGLVNELRIPCPDRIILPTGPASSFEDGYAPLASGDGQHVLSRCRDAVVLDCAYGGRYAVGSDSPRTWLAAVYAGRVLLVRATDGEAPLLADRTRLRVLVDRPSGYAELAVTGPGTEGNTLEISQHAVPPNLPPCELADRIREIAE